MALSVLQNSFLGGEIAPALYGRIDDKLVAVGAAELTNFLVNISGSLRRRPGFKFMRQLGDGIFRLIPFRFASDQTLVLVFGNKVMYVVAMGQFVMNGSQPYQVSTPYADTQLYDLSYSQNADVVTLTSPDVAPYELRRYGATDWRFQKISTLPGINPPSSVKAAASYPPEPLTDKEDEDDTEFKIQSEQKDIITAQYVVTSVSANGVESKASAVATTKCNFYLTGSTVEVSWPAVSGASWYRVYRYVSGVYGFLAQTRQCSISDSGTVPDTSQTPPSHREAFIGAASTGEIISISVLDGGSGYTNVEPTSGATITFAWLPVFDYYGDLEVPYPNLAGTLSLWYEVTLISPEGQSYTGLSLANFAIYDSFYAPGSSVDHSVNTAYAYLCWSVDYKSGAGVAVSFDQQLTIGENWRVKLVIKRGRISRDRLSTTAQLKELLNKNYSWGEVPQTNSSPQFGGWTSSAGGNAKYVGCIYFTNSAVGEYLSSSVSAAGKAHYNASPMSNYNLYNEMWEAPRGIDYAELAGGDPSIGDGLPLKISGGTGAQATANVVDGVVTSVNLLAGGSGYSSSSQVTVDSKYGSGARFKVEVSASTPAEFPRCSGQFDQRRVFAGSNSNPLKVWMTNPSQQSLMMTHVPLQADDCIEVVAVSEDADMIRHIVGMY